ncbi:MAG: hypothetical protein EXQ52_16680 [Bryobacterales bacterium]|nr:hypothetical protein [Bryobacterales bacterium]
MTEWLRVLTFGAASCVCLARAAVLPFGIVNAVVSQTEDGAKPATGYEFRPGETVFLAFQIAGVKPSSQNKIKLKYQVMALDPYGVTIVPALSGTVDTDVAPEDKDWMPKVSKIAEIPPLGPSGRYKFALSVTDEANGKTDIKEVEFPVRGRMVEPSVALALRNFTFFRSEEDRAPLSIAAYRQGDAVWARFDITGYKIGDGNKFDVDFQVSVTGPSGNLLYTQPEPTPEQRAPFYPQRYVPAEFSLSLSKDVSLGEYGLAITVRDNAGAQKIEARHPFRVE